MVTIPTLLQAAIDRLMGYNTGAYDPDTNPLGFDEDGHRVNQMQQGKDHAAMVDFVVELADGMEEDLATAEQAVEDAEAARDATQVHRAAAEGAAGTAASHLAEAVSRANAADALAASLGMPAIGPGDIGKYVRVNDAGTAFELVDEFGIIDPTNVSPADAATGVAGAELTLEATLFVSGEGRVQGGRQFQIDTAAGDFAAPVHDSGVVAGAGNTYAVPNNALGFGVQYKWRVRYQDELGFWSNWSAPTTFTTRVVNVIGVAVQTLQKTHTRIDLAGNTLSGTQYNAGGSFYDGHGAFNLTEVTVDGQAMIRVPAMWYKRAVIASGPHAGKTGWWIADGPYPGFERHPAFMKMGQPIDQFWMGKYIGKHSTAAVNDITTRLQSISGGTVASSDGPRLVQVAKARNENGQSGWMAMSVYQLAVIQMLFMTEFASTDANTAIPSRIYRGITDLWLVGTPANAHTLIDGLQLFEKTAAAPYVYAVQMWDRQGFEVYQRFEVTHEFPGTTGQAVSLRTDVVNGLDMKDAFIPLERASGTAGTFSGNTPQFPLTLAAPLGITNSGANGGLWGMSTASTATARLTKV